MNDYEDVVYNHPVRKGEMKVVKQIHKKLPALIELCFSVDCSFSLVKKILGSSAVGRKIIYRYHNYYRKNLIIYSYQDVLLECYELCQVWCWMSK